MSRAQLNVVDAVKMAFGEAQEKYVRWLRLTIQGEDVVMQNMYEGTQDVEHDFDGMARCVENEKASFFLFCMDPLTTAKKWVLISYVPDDCSVREKMLYSSGRESMKLQLGYNYFCSEYEITDRSDLNYSKWNVSRTYDASDAPLTESEKAQKAHV